MVRWSCCGLDCLPDVFPAGIAVGVPVRALVKSETKPPAASMGTRGSAGDERCDSVADSRRRTASGDAGQSDCTSSPRSYAEHWLALFRALFDGPLVPGMVLRVF